MIKLTAKKWVGSPPANCDICKAPIGNCFIDGKTHMGPWANMCPACFTHHGAGLGTGRGQMYRKSGEEWRKIEEA